MSKTVYLIGGIGNVLFQLFEGFKQGDNIEFNTYFIQPNIFTKFILRWTIHENDILPAIENIQLVSKAPPVYILVRLLLLRLRNSDEFFYGRGVNINNNLFGYYQDLKIDRDLLKLKLIDEDINIRIDTDIGVDINIGINIHIDIDICTYGYGFRYRYECRYRYRYSCRSRYKYQYRY